MGNYQRQLDREKEQILYSQHNLSGLCSGGDQSPGDDIQIQFKIGDSTFTNLSDAPRLAVYDKKELWRANLYIDERTSDADRTHDWNDQHPWIGEVDANGTPDPNGANFNQWNVKQDGSTGNGGQVVKLPSYTWPGDQNAATGVGSDQKVLPPTTGNLPGYRVSYDPFGQDTPFDFAIKMSYQKSFLHDLLDSNNEPVWVDWNSSAAPPLNSTNYRNYVVTPSDWSGANYNALAAVFTGGNGIALAGSITPATRLALTPLVPGVVGDPVYPYVPSLAFVWGDNMGNSIESTLSLEQESAGIDCVGFVHQSLAYKGWDSTYSTTDGLTVPTQGGIWYGNNVNQSILWRNTADPSEMGALTTVIIDSRILIEINNEAAYLKYLVPGDVFYYSGTSEHIGFVFQISGSDENSISLIESVYNHFNTVGFGGAINERMLSILSTDGHPWVLGRIKQ